VLGREVDCSPGSSPESPIPPELPPRTLPKPSAPPNGGSAPPTADGGLLDGVGSPASPLALSGAVATRDGVSLAGSDLSFGTPYTPPTISAPTATTETTGHRKPCNRWRDSSAGLAPMDSDRSGLLRPRPSVIRSP